MLNKKICFLLCVLFIVFPAVAQEFPQEDPNAQQDQLDAPDTANDDEILPDGESQSKKDAPAPALQRNFVIIDAGHEYDLDPHTATYSSEAQILSGLYEGLYSYDPVTLDPVPALAISYKISRDKKRWTFTLRDNALFSNGDPITASVIRDSWLSLLATPDAPYASLLDCITDAAEYRNGKCSADDVGIIARDDATLVVTLNSPTAHLQRLLCHHAFSAVSTKENVYSGAFAVQEYAKGKLILVRNEAYWDKKNVALPQITVFQSDDLAENTWKYNKGDADWISGMVDTQKLLSKDSIRIAAEFGTEYLFFSCKNEPWTNPDLRNALLTAVPWKELRANSLVPATTLVYPLTGYPTVEGLSDDDADEALMLMKAARKSAGIAQDKVLTITFGISGSERMKKEAELLKAAWEPLGVNLVVQTTPEDRYLTSISGWNADLFSYSWIGDFADPLAFLELFRDGSTLSESKWTNDKFSQLLAQAADTTSTTEHYKLLAQAEQVLLDSGVVLPISHPVSLHAIDLQSVGGWSTNALDIHPFKYLYLKQNTSSLKNLILTMR
jgi:oligopeptide transport system substrate-binding protein